MIEKRDGYKGNKVRVIFEVPEEVAQDKISVVGDFNNWDPDAHPMRKLKKGTWKKEIYLDPGQSYQFRYFVDGHKWHNDEAADRYTSTSYASDNCIIDL